MDRVSLWLASPRGASEVIGVIEVSEKEVP
jgi:hypothetical protein